VSVEKGGGSLLTQGQHLTFKPSSVVAERLRALGRTEDVVFSPDQTRLAIAGFNEHKVLVVQITIVTENGVMSVQSEACVELHCSDFKSPHGLAWIDDGTLVVANRGKDVIVVSVPAVCNAGEAVEIDPLLRLSKGSDGIIRSPGSIAVTRLNDDYFDFLVCNNYRHYISRHIIHRSNGFEAISDVRLFEHGLKVPDGIAISTDGELVAVSNHHGKRVDVFRNDAGSGTQSHPVFSLGIPHYPHGVRFAMEDRLILVADAGAPLVHVFARDGSTWKGAENPLLSIKVIDDDAFRRGHKNPMEGGPKGLDILADGSLFVVSCEEVPIAFFDFRSVRDRLVEPDTTNHRHFRSSEARLLDTIMATMKGQHDQMGALRAEVAQLKPKRDPSLDQRLLRLLKRAAVKALGSGHKR
jgi:DNA-binding beta-propeller fold protein YncE